MYSTWSSCPTYHGFFPRSQPVSSFHWNWIPLFPFLRLNSVFSTNRAGVFVALDPDSFSLSGEASAKPLTTDTAACWLVGRMRQQRPCTMDQCSGGAVRWNEATAALGDRARQHERRPPRRCRLLGRTRRCCAPEQRSCGVGR